MFDGLAQRSGVCPFTALEEVATWLKDPHGLVKKSLPFLGQYIERVNICIVYNI